MSKKGNPEIWLGIEKAFSAKGYDELEVYVEEDKSTEVSISSNHIESVENVESCGFGIRAIVNGRVGFAFTSSIENILATAEYAIANAHISELSLKAFPNNKKIPKVEKLFDKRILNMDIETHVELANQLISHAKSSNKSVKITDGGISSSVFSTYLMNSNGLSFFEEGTNISAGLAVIAEKSNGFWAWESRMLDFKVNVIANKASQMAILGLRKKKIDEGFYDVILSPFVFSEIMENLFSSWIDAENVQRGESPLAGRLGTVIGPEWLGIVDDGTLRGGLASGGFDREGVRT
ncbi:MAG: TldD/PmbA family protein, partial [Thermoplasmata archaeon]